MSRVEFIPSTSQKISGEIVLMVVLVTDWVEEGSLGMVATFCHHDQAKMEPSEVLSTLLQHDSPKLSSVVVKIFANPPYFPQGVFWLPLSGCNHSSSGHISHPIPTGSALPTQAAPFFIHAAGPAT